MGRDWSPPQGARVHRVPYRVYLEDTDAGGIVYYANHLRFAERGRTEMLRAAGISHAAMMREEGLALAVRHCTIDFLRPARLDDEIVVETAIAAMAGATLALKQLLRRGGDELSRLDVKIACVGRDGKARRMPVNLREAIRDFNATIGIK